MLKQTLLMTCTLIMMVLSPRFGNAWDPLPNPPAAAPLAWIAANPNASPELWAASAHEIFRMNHPHQHMAGWLEAGFIQGSESIKRLFVHPSQDVFILTDISVYRHSQASSKLSRIFSRPTEADTPRLSFAIAPWLEPAWFAGTSEGLYISNDEGKTWSPHLSLGHGQPIFFLASSSKCVFIGIGNTLYRAASASSAEPVFRFASDLNHPSDETEAAEEAYLSTNSFEPVLLSNTASGSLWLSSPQGLAQSTDEGKSWALLPSIGLTGGPIRALAYSEKTQTLFASAGAHVFAYHSTKQRWYPLAKKFIDPIISLLVSEGMPDKLIAASETGLFSYAIVPETLFPTSEQFIPPEYENYFKQRVAAEPTPQEVQKAVVRYSNLTNSKIRRWQKESRLRALFPSFSLGRDFSRANTLDLDRGGTADPDHYISGPDDIDEGLSVDLSWDLGDLIWSPSQTSIDIREKLMVDQRRDFLAEAMRIYFERRRVQAELFFAKDFETRRSFEKQLHYEELTALLDALTGGWFSEQLEEIAFSG